MPVLRRDKLRGGKRLLVRIPGANKLLARCKEGEPCVDCAGATVGATVTVTGICTDQTECDQAAGAYGGVLFTDLGASCIWQWTDGVSTLTLEYGKALGIWVASLTGVIAGQAILFGAPDVVTAVSCIGGELVGAFTLAGIDRTGFGDYDCSGCTANVTLP